MQKRDFVDQLVFNVASEVRRHIENGNVPEEWDGHELRVWLAKKFNDSASMSCIAKDKRGRRRRDFENEILVRDLCR